MYWDLYDPQPSCGTAVADSVRPGKGKHMQEKKQKKAKSKKVKKAVKQDYETCPECHAVYDDEYSFYGMHYCGFNH
mgnify:CR=1 FL=1